MKIIVIIPTLNEKDNISFITKIVDAGLKKIQGEPKAIIVNADSGSHDNTQETFLNTKTYFPKKALLCKRKNGGKGRNIFEVLKHYRRQADYFIMLDADIVSAKKEWVNKFLKPLIHHRAELIIPIYKRNRYEGNTTNHFSSPLIYACFGKNIDQPIAGDFAFTRKFANKLYESFSCNCDYNYGVDTLITWTALLNKYGILQVKLGKKIHKPSFSKIVNMFTQVASSSLRLVNDNRAEILSNLNNNLTFLYKSECIDDKYISAPSRNQIKETGVKAFELIRKYNLRRISLPKRIPKTLNKERWVDILNKYIIFVLSNKLNLYTISIISKSLTGYYLLRVLGYFKEIDKISSDKVEKLLTDQKNLLRNNLVGNFL